MRAPSSTLISPLLSHESDVSRYRHGCDPPNLDEVHFDCRAFLPFHACFFELQVATSSCDASSRPSTFDVSDKLVRPFAIGGNDGR